MWRPMRMGASWLPGLALLALAGAVRVSENEGLEDERMDWSFSGNPKQVCGSSEIWEELSGEGMTLESSLNTKWAKMEEMKEALMKQQADSQQNLEHQLEDLAARLKEALEKESLKAITSQEHTELLSAGLGEGSFQGAESAAQWKCGKPPRREEGKKRERPPRWLRGAYASSLELFRKASKDFFAKKEFRLDGEAFLKECGALLVKGDGADVTYCDQLCQELKDIAVSDSYAAVGQAAGNSHKLKDEIGEAQQALDKVKASMEQCKVDWSSIMIFKDQMLTMKTKVESCHAVLREAESGLDDLDWEVENLQEELEEEQEKLRKAAEKLKEAGKETEQATKALEESIAKTAELKGTITELTGSLTNVKGDLAAAERANAMIAKLKGHVTGTMMVMMQFADAALREPLRNLGFTEDKEDLEVPNPEGSEAAGVLKQSLSYMHGYCADTAMPAFNEAKSLLPELDLTPLCGFEEVDSMFGDLTQQVVERTAKMKEDLLHVVDWLNPWKVQKKMSMEEARQAEEQLEKEGQLMYLEQVKAMYTGSSFFPYLIGWRKAGPHHALILKLKDLIVEMQAKVEKFQQSLIKVQAAFEEAQKAQEHAVQALQQAKENEAASAAEKAALEETVANLIAEGQKLQKEREDWEAKVAKAKKDLEEAKQALLTAYSEGVASGEEAGAAEPLPATEK